MSNLLSVVSRTLVLCSCFALVVGCQPGASTVDDGHDHGAEDVHAHPDNYADLVHAIDDLGEKVLGAFAEGNGEAVHDDLHEVGHMLEDVASLAKEAGMEGEGLEVVAAAAESAFVAFGALDTFHDDNSVEIDLPKITADAKAALAILHAHEPEGSGHHDEEGHDEHDGHGDEHEGHDEDGEDHDDHDEEK